VDGQSFFCEGVRKDAFHTAEKAYWHTFGPSSRRCIYGALYVPSAVLFLFFFVCVFLLTTEAAENAAVKPRVCAYCVCKVQFRVSLPLWWWWWCLLCVAAVETAGLPWKGVNITKSGREGEEESERACRPLFLFCLLYLLDEYICIYTYYTCICVNEYKKKKEQKTLP